MNANRCGLPYLPVDAATTRPNAWKEAIAEQERQQTTEAVVESSLEEVSTYITRRKVTPNHKSFILLETQDRSFCW